MRAMWLHYPDDARARGLGTQFLWGRDLLVAPVFTKGATSREVYLPKGDWYDWWTNEKAAGGASVTRAVDLGTLPLYVRAGAIVPFDPVRQYTSQPVTEPTTLRIYAGADGLFTSTPTTASARTTCLARARGSGSPGTTGRSGCPSSLPRRRAPRTLAVTRTFSRPPAAGRGDEGCRLRRQAHRRPVLSAGSAGPPRPIAPFT